MDEGSVPSECRTATNFLDYCENMLSAEEVYFHTVFMNTPHCQNLDTRYMRWVHWLQVPKYSRVQGSGFRVQGSGFRVQGLGPRA